MTTIATNKAKEVEAKVNKVEAKGWDVAVNIAAKVEKCVNAKILERVLQDKNSLKVCIGGLLKPWITNKNEDFDKSLTILADAIHPIQLDIQDIESISNGERVSVGHAIIAFTHK